MEEAPFIRSDKITGQGKTVKRQLTLVKRCPQFIGDAPLIGTGGKEIYRH